MSQVSGLIPKLNSKQDSIQRGTGFLKRTGLVWSYDPSTYLTSFTETDPIYSAWNKSTGISITKSQVSDFPTLFSGSYTDLTNKPALFSGTYSDLTGKPTLFSGSYLDLTNKPTIPAAQVQTDWNATTGFGVLLNKPTQLSQFTNNLGNYGGWITGINSSMVTTALGFTPIQLASLSSSATGLTYTNTTGVFSLTSGYSIPTTSNISTWNGLVSFPGFGTSHSTAAYGDHNHSGVYEPVFTKNTGFNKNFGSTTGTVLEGRTFGSAASSNVVDFIQNQNTSAQSANMWISGQITTGTRSMFNSNDDNIQLVLNRSNSDIGSGGIGANASNCFMVADVASGLTKLSISTSGAATFASTVNSTGFLLNGNNLTSSLSTNYIPKWNGSSMVNSLISDDGEYLILSGNKTIKATTTSNVILSGGSNGLYINNKLNTANIANFGENGNIYFYSTTASTSPTTGALVTPGGIGVGGNSYFNGYITSTGFKTPTGTSSQFLKADGSVDGTVYKPNFSENTAFNKNFGSTSGTVCQGNDSRLISSLTTIGTSGAATFSGGVLNVPNYSGNSTGGTYSASIVNVNGISSSSVTNSMYTSINGIYTVVNRVTLTNNSNSLSFRISLPSTASTTSIVGVASGEFYVTPFTSITYYSSTYATVTCFFSGLMTDAVLDISITYK